MTKGEVMEIGKKLLYHVGFILLTTTSLMATPKSAIEIIHNAYTYVGQLPQYELNALVVDNDEGETYQHHVTVKLQRPNHLSIESKGDVKNRVITFDNGHFSMYDTKFKYYGTLETPKTIDKMLDFLFEKYGIRTPLVTLMYSDMNSRTKYQQTHYFGEVEVSGVVCDYVALRIKGKEVHIWIALGKKPLVKNFSVIEGENRIDTTLDWDIKPHFIKEDFIFSVPKGASKVSIESAY